MMIAKYDILIVILVKKILLINQANVCFFQGRLIQSMVAHQEAVTSLAIDPQQTCLLSGSKNKNFIRCKEFIFV
jgi:hypothetical protein